MTRHTRSLLMLAAAVMTTTLACGSQPDEDAPTTAPTAAETPTTTTVPTAPATPSSPAPSVTTIPGTRAHGALAECLSEHGVSEPSGPAPGPAAAPPGVDQSTWDDAMRACSSLGPGPAGG